MNAAQDWLIRITPILDTWIADEAARIAADQAALRAECAERAKEIAVPVSLLKPRCDACRERFEPSELTAHEHCGLGLRRYCRGCYTPDYSSGNAHRGF